MVAQKRLTEFPEIIAEWSPENLGTPEDFTAGSNKMAFWICSEGHEWKDSISHRTSGRGCPYCSNHRVGYGNSFGDQKPEFLLEWDFDLNTIDPFDITPGSQKLAFWKCKLGHSWQIPVVNRTSKKGSGCPYCSGRLPLPGETLFEKHPELRKEWCSSNTIDPRKLHPGTLKRAKWVCPNGHNYERTIRSRTSDKLGCEECNSFGHSFPELVSSWHESNQKSPYEYSQGSGKKVLWRCSEGHEWPAVIASRRLHGCPYCSGQKVTKENNFQAKFPHPAKCWDLNKNEDRPDQVLSQTNKKFWFICENGHSFEANLNNIANGKWCPYCSNKQVGYGNSLADTNTSLASEWHLTKNKLKASEITEGSSQKAWWVCEKGHEWEANIASRNKGSGCPYCTNRKVGFGNSLAELFPDIAAEIATDLSPIDPRTLVAGSGESIWWRCSRGHTWQAPVIRRTGQGAGCRYCSSQTSAPEIRVYTELKALFPDASGREKINGKEADILLPQVKVAIEYDGSYFHNDKAESDEAKRNHFFQNGYDVIRLRENPLPLSRNDLRVEAIRGELTKADLNGLIALIGELRPDKKEQCKTYLSKKRWIADAEFKRILSYLPGPPEEESLKEIFEEVANEWNYEKNFPLRPEMFHPKSGRNVWWRCGAGHEWEATINKRSGAGRGCPYCANKKVGYGNSLGDLFSDLAREWFHEGNFKLTPFDVTPGSGKRVWWKCKNGHIFRARVTDRANKGGKCRYCSGPGRGRKYSPPLNFE